MDIDAQGVPGNIRVLASYPSGAFDEITAQRAALLRFEPAQVGGKAVACRGYSQRIRWQIPQDADLPPASPPPS